MRLASKRAVVESGKRLAVSPAPVANEMFRMLAGYYNQAKELVTCDERDIPHHVESRALRLLFPDSAVGLRVFSLAEFGPFE
jgi:hypothetical protein